MRIAVVGGYAQSLIAFRGDLLKAMVAAGHDVMAIAPEDDENVRQGLREMRVAYARVPFERTGLNPFRDLAALLSLAATLRAFRAETVLTYTVKPVIYGTLAAWLAGVPDRAAMITGVGSALAGGASTSGWLSRLVRTLYRIALRRARVVFFQNPDDEALFRRLGLVGSRHHVCRINGSGIALDRFTPAPLPPGPVTFLMIARLIRDKGVCEFVEAARLVRKTNAEARFQLLGPLDANPSAISASELEAWRRDGAVEYLGSTNDVRPYIAQAHVCVLPSYAEGTPRSLLEAMAMGRAILTTDAPGCRETVVPGRNGLLVPIRDAEALAAAMRKLAASTDTLQTLGQESRLIAEQRFDVHEVNRVILAAVSRPAGAGPTTSH